MTYETILVEQRDAVTLVTLNRPQALNALNGQVLADLIAAFAAYDADADQRCLVLTGSEKAFAAGADIKEMAGQGFAQMYASNFFAGWERVTETRKPWIAAVSGFALGGGCEVAMMADFIIAADTAKFGQPEIKLGVTPGMGGSQRLTRAIGKAKAMEMCLTGRMMGAEEAERSGLVARVVPAAALLDEALKIAAAIAAMPPLAAIACKEMVGAADETMLAQGILFERRLFHGLFGTDDQKEGMAAFVEKRPGVWAGEIEQVPFVPSEVEGPAAKGASTSLGTNGDFSMRIAFIGLGNMGGGMAANLAKAGHHVAAFDLSEAALDRARAAGCDGAVSAAEAVAGADVVVTMLPAGRHVRQVYDEQVGPNARRDALLIDCSTIDIDSARATAAAMSALGIEFVDAPVSGGIAAADGGTLTFMVGGSAEGFARAAPILSNMGKAVIHAGEAGAGQAAKICNNMILGATMIATAEAFVLAEKLGLDAQTFFDISSKASGQSWSMTSYCPVPGPVPTAPSNRDYEGGFQAALMLKDLKLAVSAAQSADSPVPMAANAAALYQAFVGLGAGNKDFSGIIRLLDGGYRRD